MPTQRPRVLISGASVAGPVLAYWLHRFGFAPTVIERTPAVRVGGGGHAVDVPAEALSEGVPDRHAEIMRGDLARILYEVTRDHVEYVFDDSVTTLHERGRAVEVTFDAEPRGPTTW
jgi:2-polyprenyl-6-methoxyphenol hydroxylase-like FAD-dependent oxidoreductase